MWQVILTCGDRAYSLAVTIEHVTCHPYLWWHSLQSCCHHWTCDRSSLPVVTQPTVLLSPLNMWQVILTCGETAYSLAVTIEPVTRHPYLWWHSLQSCCHHWTCDRSYLPVVTAYSLAVTIEHMTGNPYMWWQSLQSCWYHWRCDRSSLPVVTQPTVLLSPLNMWQVILTTSISICLMPRKFKRKTLGLSKMKKKWWITFCLISFY